MVIQTVNSKRVFSNNCVVKVNSYISV